MKKTETKLKPLAACEGCRKRCVYKGNIAIEEGDKLKFGCNTSK